MRRIIRIFLCASLILLCSERKPARASSTGAVLIVFCACTGCVITFWVYKTYETPRLRWLVLEKAHYDGNWVPVTTNQVWVTAHLAKAFPAFRDYMTDAAANYRVHEIAAPAPNFRVGIIPGSAEQPFLYTVQ